MVVAPRRRRCGGCAAAGAPGRRRRSGRGGAGGAGGGAGGGRGGGAGGGSGGGAARGPGERGADQERPDEHDRPARVGDEAADLREPRDRRQPLRLRDRRGREPLPERREPPRQVGAERHRERHHRQRRRAELPPPRTADDQQREGVGRRVDRGLGPGERGQRGQQPAGERGLDRGEPVAAPHDHRHLHRDGRRQKGVLQPGHAPDHERRDERAGAARHGGDGRGVARHRRGRGQERAEHHREQGDRERLRVGDVVGHAEPRAVVEQPEPVPEGEQRHPRRVREALDGRRARLQHRARARRHGAGVGEGDPGVVDLPPAVQRRVACRDRGRQHDGDEPPQAPRPPPPTPRRPGPRRHLLPVCCPALQRRRTGQVSVGGRDPAARDPRGGVVGVARASRGFGGGAGSGVQHS